MPYYAMADSRPITDYRPSCDVNNALMNQYKISNNHDYRQYMQKNGSKIITDLATQNSPAACKECPVCKEVLDFGSKPPVL